MRKILLLVLFLTPFIFMQAQLGYGERLVTPVNMALGVNGEGVKEKVIFFEVPFKESEIFTTLAFKFFNIQSEAITLEISLAHDDSKFTEWKPLHFDHHVDASAGFVVTELEYIEATYNRVRIKVKTDQLKKFKAEAHWFLPSDNFTLKRQSLPSTQPSSNCELPSYVTRTGWNCPSGQDYSSGSPSFTNVSHLVVHHSAGANTSTNWPAVVLSIWNYHRFTNGWADIGYNALIDPNGVIYEGRGGNEGYTKDVLSAATCGSNSGSMAICILGNYNEVEPSAAALESLESMLAWKAEDRDIDPLGSSSLNSFGVLDHIFGHRQGCSTSCPGDHLYDQLPTIRQHVDDLVTNGCQQGTPHLKTISYAIDDDNLQDSNGDDDGLADVGETIEIYLTVLNDGTIPVSNVIANIATNESCITIIDSDFSFGTLAVGQDSLDGDFDIQITENCIDQDVEFYITYTSDQGSWTDTIVIHIYDDCVLPVVNFSVTPQSGLAPLLVTTQNASANALSYAWEISGPDTISSIANEPDFSLTIPGSYSVLLTAFNECGTDQLLLEDYIEVLEVTALYDQQMVISLYPNPVNDYLNIELGRIIESFEVTVVNPLGEEVSTNCFSGNKAQLDVADLATGYYIIRITDVDQPQQVVTYPFIKSKL
ncbi:MAG: N-acetylmuramoyl-L-alanine amidase [Chitinophagales bacterium]